MEVTPTKVPRAPLLCQRRQTLHRGAGRGGAVVPVVPEPRGEDAACSVSVTSAWERELCWFMAVAAVARLLLPRLSIWNAQRQGVAYCRVHLPRCEHSCVAPWAALPGAESPGWAHPSR